MIGDMAASVLIPVYLHDADVEDGPQQILYWQPHIPLPRPDDHLRIPPPSPIGAGVWTVLSVGFAVGYGGGAASGNVASIELDVTRHPERYSVGR